MPRTADYTIQGFLYQFNKTIKEILISESDQVINIEGIVEDIEIVSSESTTAIQCKYHETNTSFTTSDIYKPLLQMLKHFSDHPTDSIRYVLFAHFSDTTKPSPTVGKVAFKSAIASKDKSLQKYIKSLPTPVDLDGFEEKFVMEIGPSYDDLVAEVSTELGKNGFPAKDIETLAYPNAVQIVASLSVKHNASERQITKKQFLTQLESIRTTAISHWTLALKTRAKLLLERRKQLKLQLGKNARLRYFLIEPSNIEDFETEIVLFINDYIDKYHFKPAHIKTPILCVNAKRDEIQDIQDRLYAKGLISTDGYVGTQFKESHFFREPMSEKVAGGKFRREFDLRILSWQDNGTVLNQRKCDDLFIIGDQNGDGLGTVDINVERLAGTTMKEIKYLMGVSDDYE